MKVYVDAVVSHEIVNWDAQVLSNNVCRKLRKSVVLTLSNDQPNQPNDPRILDYLGNLFTVIFMNKDKNIPYTFRNWSPAPPKYWVEVMNDVDRMLAKQMLHTEDDHR